MKLSEMIQEYQILEGKIEEAIADFLFDLLEAEGFDQESYDFDKVRIDGETISIYAVDYRDGERIKVQIPASVVDEGDISEYIHKRAIEVEQAREDARKAEIQKEIDSLEGRARNLREKLSGAV